jgi:peptidoglycan/xylan/chitin deacetylase (PgdA/CDA1 family)
MVTAAGKMEKPLRCGTTWEKAACKDPNADDFVGCPGVSDSECPPGEFCFTVEEIFEGCDRYDNDYSVPEFFRDCVGRETENLFVLSFDDGPHQHTEGLLNVLKEKNAPATFFWIGSQWENNPKSSTQAYYNRILRRVLDEGHALANRGLDNDRFTVQDVLTAHGVFKAKTGGYLPHFFRPARGFYRTQDVEILTHATPYNVSMWNLDVEDWRSGRKPQEIFEFITSALINPTEVPVDQANAGFPRRGSFIMLAHDNQDVFLKTIYNPIAEKETTLLAATIDMIRFSGYEIVSMDECVGATPSPHPEEVCGACWVDAVQCKGGGKCNNNNTVASAISKRTTNDNNATCKVTCLPEFGSSAFTVAPYSASGNYFLMLLSAALAVVPFFV